jgi:hypothetical protein
MSEETEVQAEAIEVEEAPVVEKEYSGRKIMCFVSKKMVPLEDTIEVEFTAGKSYRVLPKYVRA